MTNTNTAADFNAILVDTYQGQPITRGMFEAAFNRVANQENWKLPVDAQAVLRTGLEIYTLHQAIIFFTGSVPKLIPLGADRYQVKAAGYYEACGA